ncbi:hypothetical protein PSH28_04170, partial [Pseudomonas resinovorans]|uniref:hypothetical protein n=1 Tax=Metapseudomonas resinovorans TaxID=53412 RepID=UPI00237F301E
PYPKGLQKCRPFFIVSTPAFHATRLIELHQVAGSLLWLIVIEKPTILAAYAIGFSQGALDIGAGHAAANLLANDGLASLLRRNQVSASVLSLADHYYFLTLF